MERERYKKVTEEKIFQLEARVKELGGKLENPALFRYKPSAVSFASGDWDYGI